MTNQNAPGSAMPTPVIAGGGIAIPNLVIEPPIVTPFNVAPPPGPDQLADTTGNNAYFNNLNIRGSIIGGGGLSIPLTQNLTFSPDSTLDIGNSDFSGRPRQLYISDGITFRQTSNTSILRYDPTMGHALALTPTTGTPSNEQVLNIYAYYTNPDWVRLSIGPYGIITQRQGSLLPHVDLLIGSEDIESIIFETNFSNRWKIDGTTGHLLAMGSYDVGGVSSNKVRNVYAGQFIPTSKSTVSGSRAANAALASLLTALASYGLITDGSTA